MTMMIFDNFGSCVALVLQKNVFPQIYVKGDQLGPDDIVVRMLTATNVHIRKHSSVQTIISIDGVRFHCFSYSQCLFGCCC